MKEIKAIKKMDKKIMKSDDTEYEEHKFDQYESPYFDK